jgi:hypothetical protein
MTDITQRLRAFVAGDAMLAEEAIAEAADEIERLMAEQGGIAMAAEQHGRVAERAELMPRSSG